MCTTPASRSQPPSPQWRALYAIFAAMFCGLAVTVLGTSPLTRAAVGFATAVLTLAALAWWLSVNRVALDLASWCECASGTVIVRTIGAAAPRRRADAGLRFGDPERLADHQAAREQEEQGDEVEAHAEPAHRE